MPRDIPIIFSAPMVRALLDGRKTQTRRLAHQDVRSQRNQPLATKIRRDSPWREVQPGDRLWVRENFATSDAYGYPEILGVEYAADGSTLAYANGELHHKEHGCAQYTGPWKPSIHMPRWASRLTLIVEGVKVERLQDISEDDAEVEGVVNGLHDWDCRHPYFPDPAGYCVSGCGSSSYQEVFQRLWNSINGPDAWDANPWVVAISFRVERANIDALKGAA
ncbi:hypothetical protein J2847_004090 [Azospirillum agricola]|uniref:hypothetical protein n=1 Tax=Azospirillum agricola TaxID=1720247 RepID=UPI001AE23909|nr:hypothetical protein [Azospirillum agricola]MBP2230781.1 hypothetical protein [Azospirillum agricola]